MTKTKEYLEILAQTGYSHLAVGAFEEAIETFSEGINDGVKDERFFRGRGLAYVQIQKPDLAEKDFRIAFDLKKTEPENWAGLALSLFLQNNIYEAIRIYDELLSWRPDYVVGHIQLGKAYLKIGLIAKAKDCFQTALSLRPNLEQRRFIESTLKEQEKLDKNRYYRPDFGRLNKNREKSKFTNFFERIFARF